jgi:hypothetical protein
MQKINARGRRVFEYAKADEKAGPGAERGGKTLQETMA